MSIFTNGLPAHHRRSLSRACFRAPIWSGLLGITLLLPATWFMLTLLIRVCFGSAALYYYIAPSFLQSPFGIFAWHKAQVILCGAILAIVLNMLTVLKFQFQQGSKGPEIQIWYRRYWLNTAVMLQGSLLLITLLTYTIIQHIRY